MQPASVVEPFQVLEDGTPRYLSIGETSSMHELGLQGGDEALCHRVVQGGSGPSHRRNDADLFEALAEGDRCVLDAAVGMMHESRRWLTPPHRHLEGIHHKLGSHVGVHRPPDDPTRMGVQDEGQVEEALPRRYVRDVRHPDPVGLSGHEVPAKQIWGGSSPRIAAGGSTLLAPHTTPESLDSHQSSYPPACAFHSERTQLGMYPWVAVGLAAPAMDLADHFDEKCVPPSPLRRRPAAPGVVAALGHSKHPA